MWILQALNSACPSVAENCSLPVQRHTLHQSWLVRTRCWWCSCPFLGHSGMSCTLPWTGHSSEQRQIEEFTFRYWPLGVNNFEWSVTYWISNMWCKCVVYHKSCGCHVTNQPCPPRHSAIPGEEFNMNTNSILQCSPCRRGVTTAGTRIHTCEKATMHTATVKGCFKKTHKSKATCEVNNGTQVIYVTPSHVSHMTHITC